jgi:hypothetical protein
MLKLVAVAVLLAASISSQAQTSYTATLDAAQAGGGGRTGSGSGTLTLNGTTLSWNIDYTGLSTPDTLAHIHGPAAPGSTAPVLFPFTGTFNVTFGNFTGSATGLTAQQISDLNAGLDYVNIHTTAFGGGEIRGQITQVPEPSTIALGSVAALGMLTLRRRRA